MIRYDGASVAEIRTQIDAHNPDWMQKASDATSLLVSAGRFTPARPKRGEKKAKAPPSLWSDVKIVYMRLQQFKCIFCERGLAHEDGSIEHDVEHYRPKNALKAWRAPRAIGPIPHQGGGAADTGYYWLAYDIGNYAAACKPCNSTQKSSYFPISGNRGKSTETIIKLDKDEKPLVIFPMCEDPSTLITFHGILVIPVHKTGPDHLRAAVTISLFKLNTREELKAERFRTIRSVFSAFELLQTSPDEEKRNDGAQQLTELTGARSPQSACAKAYLELLRKDPDTAWSIYREARAYVRV